QEERLASWTSKPAHWERIELALTPRTLVLANIDRYYQQQIAESKKPVRKRIDPSLPTDLWSRTILSLTAYELNDIWRWRRIERDLALREVARPVRMHFLTHARYPSRLGETSTRWLPAVPRDLWDQPIAYRLRDGEPVVYSLGPDGKDDGGTA